MRGTHSCHVCSRRKAAEDVLQQHPKQLVSESVSDRDGDGDGDDDAGPIAAPASQQSVSQLRRCCLLVMCIYLLSTSGHCLKIYRQILILSVHT